MKQYDIGIDLGTTSIIIATEEQGVVFRQPPIGGGGRGIKNGGPRTRAH